MQNTDVQIEFATRNDLPVIARIHAQAFPASFSTQLGQKYREKMLEWYFSTTKTFILVAKESDGKILGYVTGMVRDGTLKTGSSSGMAQHSFNQGMASLAMRPWLLFHKEIRGKFSFILRNLKARFSSKKPATSPVSKAPVEAKIGLVIIAVSHEAAGKGVGSALIAGFESVAVEKYHIHSVYLTVESDNARAIKTYEKSGWMQSGRDGHSCYYEKSLQ